MIRTFSKLLHIKQSSSLFTKSIRFSSHLASDEEEYLVDEVVDNLYETHLQEEFSRLYSTKYTNAISGYATPKETQHYSARSSSSKIL